MSPPNEGPSQGLQEDFMANGPAVLQMNIAVYDDKVLWVVPGSHKRPNTNYRSPRKRLWGREKLCYQMT